MNKPMIPSMGGREMGPVYDRFIEAMPDGLDVVEIGAWLGAGTYELAASLIAHGHDKSTLHVYDRFKARAQEVRKAAGNYKYRVEGVADGLGTPIKLREGQDTLPIVKAFMEGLATDIRFYKGDIKHFQYTGKTIGVMVIDAAKKGREFGRIMAKIEPHLAPGAVVFFMDYWFYEWKKGTGTECQHKYVKASGKYTHLESYKNLCCEVMRYAGA